MMKVRIAALVARASVAAPPLGQFFALRRTLARFFALRRTVTTFAIYPALTCSSLLHGFCIQWRRRALVIALLRSIQPAALTLRIDGLAMRAIAHAGQFDGVDVLSSTTCARFQSSSEAALTIAVDDFTLRANALAM